jgi:plasmid stabilization system protein ParE
MKLRFTTRATENIAAAADYIRPRNPAGAAGARAAIYRSLHNLLLFPEMGRLQKHAGVRKLITGGYHYIIYYTIDRDADEIVILNVKHPAQMRYPESY